MTETTTARRPRLRVLATDYRTRLLLAIVFVVAVALLLVLVSLPRLLEGYLLDQELVNRFVEEFDAEVLPPEEEST